MLRSVFEAQGFLGRGANLPTIVKVGDGINRAIFNYKELNEGLARLIDAGYVTSARGRFHVSPAMRREFKSLSRLPGSLKDKRLLEFLKAQAPGTRKRRAPSDSSSAISPEEYQAAVEKYSP